MALFTPLPGPADDVLSMIGRTPIVKVRRLDTGPCELYLKLESSNPGGSIKDRVGLSMILAAEQAGQLGGGRDHIVEATAGNTGLGLALVAAWRGYRLTLVIPDKMSREKVLHLRALGAEVIITRSDVSQLPVLEGGRIVGLLDESDLLREALFDRSRLQRPVSEVMSTRLRTVAARSTIRDLLPLFDEGLVPIVVDGDEFLGLITRIDLFNYLHRGAVAAQTGGVH